MKQTLGYMTYRYESVIDIGKKQQGSVIYFSLVDKVRIPRRDIVVAHLNKDEGLKLVSATFYQIFIFNQMIALQKL